MPASVSGDWRLVDLLIVPDMVTTFCTLTDLQYHYRVEHSHNYHI